MPLKARQKEEVDERNAGKKIYFHPGWGFLSEDAKFVAELEKEAKEFPNIVFVGPCSEPMREIGSKMGLRDVVAKVAPALNPHYFGHSILGVEDLLKALEEYIGNDFSSGPLNDIYRKHFDEDVVEKMGGKAMIKATEGGGGRCIVAFTYDKSKSHETNFRDYIKAIRDNMIFSKGLFNSTGMLTEQRIEGVTRHLEAQLLISNGALVLGFRDCTAQMSGQKFIETNLIERDYPPEVIQRIKEEFEKIGKEMAAKGYRGVVTLEALVKGGEIVTILEANTRVQVEHTVTEKDIALKTGKQISLPFINSLCAQHQDLSPQEIIKNAFGLEDKDLEKAVKPGSERVTHFRLNSRNIDLEAGTSTPSYFDDYQWPGTAAIRQIAKETQTTITVGGLGAGLYDPQVGMICGLDKDAVSAGEAIAEMVEISQVALDSEGTLGLKFSLLFNKIMYDEQGNFNTKISTKTADEFLKAIKKKEIKALVDIDNPTMNVAHNEEKFKAAFNEFLKLQDQKLKPNLSKPAQTFAMRLQTTI